MQKRMEPDRIKALLEKYWQAETNEAEEAELEEYFAANPGVDDHPAAPLFHYFKEEQQVVMEEEPEFIVAKKVRPIKWLGPVLKVAAVVLIVFSLVYFLLPRQKPTPVAVKQSDTYDDPEKAYLETKQALLMVARHLNAGKTYIGEIGKINKAEQLINANNKR
jgi:hypothetical protein